MTKQTPNPIAEWLRTKPGAFYDTDRNACLQKALDASGLDMNVFDFADSLKNLGYIPRYSELTFYYTLHLPDMTPGERTISRMEGYG